MARRWRRRTIIIAVVIVALSAGLVFASLPYLQPPPTQTASIKMTYTHTVAAETPNGPGNFGLTIPNVPGNEPFAVNVTVVSGMAEFCVMAGQTYTNWATFYNKSSAGPFPLSQCTYGPTKEMTHGILNFGLTAGTWDIVALNYRSSAITVYYSKVPFT
jgi:hypothetical protein